MDLDSEDSDILGKSLVVDSNNEKDIRLWNPKLGHVSFGYIKKLFPNCFVDIYISSLYCDICELAKSHRASFPLNSNKSLVPFMIIHSF